MTIKKILTLLILLSMTSFAWAEDSEEAVAKKMLQGLSAFGPNARISNITGPAAYRKYLVLKQRVDPMPPHHFLVDLEEAASSNGPFIQWYDEECKKLRGTAVLGEGEYRECRKSAAPKPTATPKAKSKTKAKPKASPAPASTPPKTIKQTR